MRNYTSIMYFISSFTLYLMFVVVGSITTDNYQLEQLQILFRHGDRTPEESTIFANDPYDEIYQSYGYGQLTKIGKEREYKIGQVLRERYNDFLGEYRNEDVHAYSSDVDRTKMSLQLVLASLYPPSPSTSWSKSVNWQPIPTRYETNEIGFLTSAFVCPRYQKIVEESQKTPEIFKLFKKYQSLYKRIENNTGIKMTQLSTGWSVYLNIRCSLSLGFPMPTWLSNKDFRELEKIAKLAVKALTGTEQLRRLAAGPVVEQILKGLDDNSKKVYLYSGHDINIAAIIDTHNITGTPDYHDFGSTVIVEKLRGQDNQIYIRLYLWTGVTEKLMPLKISNCEEICLLSDYKRIVQTILPNRKSRICPSSSVLCRRHVESPENVDFDLQLARLFAGPDLASFKYTKDYPLFTIERS